MTSLERSWSRNEVVHQRAALTALALAVVFVPAFVAIQSAQAQTYVVLHVFSGKSDGASPTAALIRDAAGNLYGTTTGGGVSENGTVFRLDASGKEAVLYSFAGPPDGASPFGGLVRDAAGNLYGTTYVGGTSGNETVFKLDASGTETVLHSFAGPPADGANPASPLVIDAAGNLYGTTYAGGSSDEGTVFKVARSGRETVLYSFGGGNDGASPWAGLILNAAGSLYGVTTLGGTSNSGTVFKVDKTGKETVLYKFMGAPDGSEPTGSLVRDSKGSFYGTTQTGGANNYGTVFKLDTLGTETVLYSFGLEPDGETPVAGLVRDSAGNLYGTTLQGGGNYVCLYSGSSCGTVFKLSEAGEETLLHSFAGSDGGNPWGGMVRDAKGNLYGTTETGGPHSGGVVFKHTP